MKTVTLPARGDTIAYDDTGTGPPLVLLHAFPFDREMWAPQRAALADVARVVTPDRPGFGASTAGAAGYTIDGMADGLAEFLDAAGLKGPVVLGGLSMGGYVALAFARRHPGRLRGLILADTKADPDDDATKATRDKQIASVRSGADGPLVNQTLPKLLSERTKRDHPAVVERARAIGARQKPDAVVAALAALRDRPDANPGLAAVRVPTLVIVGEDDAVTPPSAGKAMADGIPGAKLVPIPGAGHLSNLESPEAFNAAVRAFLAGLPT